MFNDVIGIYEEGTNRRMVNMLEKETNVCMRERHGHNLKLSEGSKGTYIVDMSEGKGGQRRSLHVCRDMQRTEFRVEMIIDLGQIQAPLPSSFTSNR